MAYDGLGWLNKVFANRRNQLPRLSDSGRQDQQAKKTRLRALSIRPDRRITVALRFGSGHASIRGVGFPIYVCSFFVPKRREL